MMEDGMQMFTADVEVRISGSDLPEARWLSAMDRLEQHHPAVGASARGWASARISLPAESLAQATSTALTLVTVAFDAEPIACEVMTEAEADAREGWETLPELVSVTEAAELLGVSRQAVLQRIASHTLPASRVGRDYVIPRAAVSR